MRFRLRDGLAEVERRLQPEFFGIIQHEQRILTRLAVRHQRSGELAGAILCGIPLVRTQVILRSRVSRQ